MARRDAPRLAAARRIAEAERAVHQAVVEAIQRWLAAVRSAVLDGGLTAAGEEPPPDLSGWSAADAIWLASIAELITPEIGRWFGEAFLAVARVATISDQPFREAHIEQVASRLRLFPSEAFEEIRPELAEAVSEGEGIDAIRDRIAAVLDFDTTAGSGGEQAATRRVQARINEVERLLEDPRTPPEDMAGLRAERSRLYPELYRLQNRWQWKARRIARTECLPAHTVITGAEITAAYRRWYSGPWIEITTESGHKLAGTPNHPVLTLAGWKGLGHVTEADYLVCDGRDVEAPRAALDMDVQHRPTTIGEVFDALAAVVVRERARGGEPDFHGDGCESDVDILRPDRPLTVGRFTPVDELAVKDILAPSDARNLIFHAESYRVRETLRAAQRVRLIAGADLSADAFEGPPYRALVDAVLDSEVTQESATLVRGDDLIEGEVSAGLYAGAAVVESDAASGRQVTRDARLADRGTDHLGTSAEFAGDALDRVPGTVQLDRVCSIRVGEWSGHVYNLTTVEGYFAANSIYTGNTVGALNGGSFAGATARAEETGETLYKEWLATDDVRTREEHREADGQVRPMAMPFLVGGFPLQFPGDPTAPGHLTINCFPGDTLVRVPSGLRRIYRRWYEGLLVEVHTEGGGKLAGTPNHPLLTDTGWKPMQGIEVGDKLIGAVVGERVGVSDPDVEDRPASFGELYRAAHETRMPSRVVSSGVNFHGDTPDGDVEVITVDRDLDSNRDASVLQGVNDLLFDRVCGGPGDFSRAGGLGGAGDADSGARRLVRLADPAAVFAPGIVGGGGESGALGEAHALHAEPVCLATRTRLDSRCQEAPADRASANAKGFGQREFRFTCEVLADDGLVERLASLPGGADSFPGWSDLHASVDEGIPDTDLGALVPPGQVRDRLSGLIALHDVRDVQMSWFRGHVYNLESDEGWYIANDIAVHNCRCATAYLDEDELTTEQLDQLTNPEPGISAAGGHAMADEETLPTGWRGVMGPLDVPTGDGRILATPPDGVRFREGTLPIMWQRETGMGHDGSVIAARVDRAWVEEVSGRSVVMGEGPFDLGGEDGREAARLLREGFLTGLSIDPDEVTVEWVLQDRQGQRVDPAGMDEGEVWDGLESGELTEVMVMTDWRLMGATMTPFPAFDEARIEPIYDYEPAPGAMAASGEPFTGRVSEVVTPHPAEHYTNPGLDRLTPLTVTDDGRVYGHIAGFSECHLSYGEDVCVTAPRSPSGYAYFHLGEVRLDTGDTLAVGKLTLGGGHADPSLGYRAAIEHYDDVATAIAAVRAGEDAYGVWVSGHLLADVTPEQLERFMLCPPSGDWRRIGGQLELVAACSVNVPGFPNVRAASGQAGQLSLVAAGARQVRRAARRPRPSGTVDTRRLAAEVARELRAMDRRTARAQEIAARIGR